MHICIHHINRVIEAYTRNLVNRTIGRNREPVEDEISLSDEALKKMFLERVDGKLKETLRKPQ